MLRDEAPALSAQDVENPSSFPDANPNPVMRVTRAGQLVYANASSAPIRDTLGIGIGGVVPDAFLADVLAAATDPPIPFELACDLRTFSILAVPLEGLDAFNVYGTDVTGAKVVEKFPDKNPNPVLRMRPDGTLIYANQASARIIHALGIGLGDRLPDDLLGPIRRRLAGESRESVRQSGDGHTYELVPVEIAEFGFVHVYGIDVTAVDAITKFPDENPNPVLRLAHDGTLLYANPASALVREALGATVGKRMPDDAFRRIHAIAAGSSPNTFEVERAGRTYELRVVSLFEFESINIYGTDVTAAKEVERANAENERLLLNILPVSIADRLRHGESLIADRFEEMAVLFADVVSFTPFAMGRPAAEVVEVLNDVFSIFDSLADAYQLEKIKTVGDAYMVVGGLTPGSAGHVERVAEMGLDMIEELAKYRTREGIALQIRVGMHVGPGIGGVIGLKKFIYDVWGDTVNTASRMESHGVPGRLQVTEATYERLRELYEFEPRGPVEVKGKGPMPTWFLTRRRPLAKGRDEARR
jgi:class 3 adenylate cyclase